MRGAQEGEGRQIGPWSVRGKLGSGGNAEVYRAIRDEAEGELALKVLHKKFSREPYLRFAREIETLRKLGALPGIVPFVDAYLPQSPTRTSPAWLAMPVVVPIADALADKPLEVIVRAVATVSSTLVTLKRTYGIAHRDIKPGNLYEQCGQWLVGDFGLVAVPDVEQLTREGKQLGPAHYTAHEMITDPVNADPFPADVYSLGKTLWVLATGQRFPPEGPQPAGTSGFSIGEFRPHAHADALDRLVEDATRIHPERRPTMEQMVADLQSWSELASSTERLDIGDLALRIRERMRPQVEKEDVESHLKDLGARAVRMLQDLSRPLHKALMEVHPQPQFNLTGDTLTRNLLLTHVTSDSPDIVFSWQACDRIACGREQFPYSLRLGRSIEVTADGYLLYRAHIHVGAEQVMGNSYSWRSDTKQARAGSIEAERLLQEETVDVAGRLKEALAAFLERMPTRLT